MRGAPDAAQKRKANRVPKAKASTRLAQSGVSHSEGRALRCSGLSRTKNGRPRIEARPRAGGWDVATWERIRL